MFVDLHLHTVHSDGCCTPVEVLHRAKAEGINVISIVDHDNINGAKKAISASHTIGINVVPGVEISVRSQKYENTDCGDIGIHILGYGVDLNSRELNEFIDVHAAKRRSCIESLLRELYQIGIYLSYDDIEVQNGTYIQISDIEKVLAKSKVDQAFVKKLTSAYKILLDEVNYPPQDAISTIINAGGIAIWAHPFISYALGEKHILQEKDISNIVLALMKSGLKGVEAYYKDSDSKQKAFLRSLAKTHGLFMSSGSDFHGYGGRNSFYKTEDADVQRLVQMLTNT